MNEKRKEREKEFHDKIRDESLELNKENYEFLTANKKFYSISRQSRSFVNDWVLKQYRGKRVLDYCCGNGELAVYLAKFGVEMTGIDISDVSIKNANSMAKDEALAERAKFFAMDAENLEFPDNSFDAVICNGVLHHLNIEKAYQELSRVLKIEGRVICDEPLAYNPVFQLYRKLTPHLRTEWEAKHILRKKDIELARQYFEKVEMNFFHLATLAVVPLRNFSGFNTILGGLEKVDSILLRLPLLKWWAWQIVFILSKPKK